MTLTGLPALFALVLACMATVQPLEAAEPPLELRPNWSRGDSVDYEVVRTRRRAPDPAPAPEASSRLPVRIVVAEAGPEGYLLDYRCGEVRIEGGAASTNALAQKLVTALTDLPMRFQVTMRGAVVRLLNWKDVQDRIRAASDALLQELARHGAPPAALDVARSQAEALVADEARVTALAARDLQILLFVLGRAYTPGAPVQYEDSAQSPLGGDPIPMRGELVLEVAPVAGVAQIHWTQRVDPDKAQAVIAANVRKLTAQLGERAPDPSVFAGLAIDDDATFEIDVASGWPRSIEHSRSLRLASTGQVDTVRFTRRQ